MAKHDPVRAPRGATLRCKGWIQEAAYRMLHNNLDAEVAERPDDLVVYGGTGKAARSWEAFDVIARELTTLGDDETLLVQSGKAVGRFRTHADAPRVLIANSNLVGRWATYDEFRRLEALGLTMYGQMTAGSWIYIGSQGIVQGTFETFVAARKAHEARTGTRRRPLGAHRGPRRHGRRAAARRHHGRHAPASASRSTPPASRSASRPATSTSASTTSTSALAAVPRVARGRPPPLDRACAPTPPTSTPSSSAAASRRTS